MALQQLSEIPMAKWESGRGNPEIQPAKTRLCFQKML